MVDLVTLKGVDKFYGTAIKTQVLFDIKLSFKEKTFNSIIGQSGSGKTTLMNIMGTLDRPTNGEVYISDKRTDSMNKNELAKIRNETIGFIFQFHYLIPEFTALENVMMPYLIRNPTPPKEIREKAKNLMTLVGLEKVMKNKANNMSGGQQQRTAIARALINDPKIVLADEPTGNLDSDNTDTVYKILRDIYETSGTTFVIITHDRLIAERTDRIVEISDGKISLDLER